MNSMRLDATKIKVSSKPPEGLDPRDGAEYTKRIRWASEVWDEVARPLSERWNVWLDRINENIRQSVLTQGDLQDPPRKNHYVPQFWMRHFATDGEGYQFSWDHRGPDKFGKPRHVGGCMYERDLSNAVGMVDDKVHATLEFARSRMESDIAPHWEGFITQGTSYVRCNLDIKMAMSEYLARLWHFSPWVVRHMDSMAAQIVQEDKYADLELPAWKHRTTVFDYLDDLIPWTKFHLFVRNWTILPTPSPLALPSDPFVGVEDIVTTPIIWVPLSRSRLLMLHWGLRLNVRPRVLYRSILKHTYKTLQGYRKMMIHPDDKRCWSRAYNLHRGVCIE